MPRPNDKAAVSYLLAKEPDLLGIRMDYCGPHLHHLASVSPLAQEIDHVDKLVNSTHYARHPGWSLDQLDALQLIADLHGYASHALHTTPSNQDLDLPWERLETMATNLVNLLQQAQRTSPAHPQHDLFPKTS